MDSPRRYPTPKGAAAHRPARRRGRALYDLAALMATLAIFVASLAALTWLCFCVGNALGIAARRLHAEPVTWLLFVWAVVVSPMIVVGGSTSIAASAHERLIAVDRPLGPTPRSF